MFSKVCLIVKWQHSANMPYACLKKGLCHRIFILKSLLNSSDGKMGLLRVTILPDLSLQYKIEDYIEKSTLRRDIVFDR